MGTWLGQCLPVCLNRSQHCDQMAAGAYAPLGVELVLEHIGPITKENL